MQRRIGYGFLGLGTSCAPRWQRARHASDRDGGVFAECAPANDIDNYSALGSR